MCINGIKNDGGKRFLLGHTYKLAFILKNMNYRCENKANETQNINILHDFKISVNIYV